MNSIKQYDFGGCSVGNADGGYLRSILFRWPQMYDIYITSFMVIGSGILIILRA
jgi:hypothetical protein